MAGEHPNGSSLRTALRIVVPYVVFASLWIFLSDHLLVLVSPDLRRFGQYSIIKGIAFVLVSAILLLMVLLAEFRARRAVEADRADLLVRERTARARAESANHAKDELLALVSHELRTPLTAVLTTAEILLEDSALSDDQKELLAGVRDGVLQEARIIGDLLDTTSLAAGRLQLRLDRSDINAMLASLLGEIARESREKSLVIHNSLSAGPLLARADCQRLEQAFRNLLANAIKFTPSGGTITVRSTPHNDRVAVAIEDTGIGIAPDLQRRLFEPFEQGDRSMTRQYGGLGLGLYLARSIIELHGGKLAFHSEGTGQGSQFVVELPAWVEQQRTPTPFAPPPVAPGRTILLVEDNVDTLRALARLLGRMGCTVIPARNAAEAIDAAAKQPIDLVVSDIGLPDRTGWDMMQELHQRRRLSGIAISGFSSDEDRKRSAAAGFTTHLVKPVTYQDLQQAIENAPLGAGAASR